MASENVHPIFDDVPTNGKHVRFSDDAWRKHLIRVVAKDGTVGGPKSILANVVTALRFSPEWVGVLALNEFSMHVTTQKPAPWQLDADVGKKNWSDYEDSRCCEWMQHEGICVGSKIVAEAVQTVARENPFHPVKDYLSGLTWDGIPRTEEWLIRYCGAEDTPFVRAASSRWLISGVARIFEPGCKVDHVLLLEGEQGVRKSSTLRALVGDDWFIDHVAELGSKDSRIDLSGKWVVEMAEMDRLRGARLERVKAFLVTQVDRFRVPYGRRSEDVRRTCIFAASVNDQTSLTDESGNRRFWPVHCNHWDVAELTAARDQLWAEAYQLYRNHKPWWLDTPELDHDAAVEQQKRFEPGVWDEIIVYWLENPQPRPDANKMTPPFVSEKGSVTLTDILVHAVGKDMDRCDQKDRNQVARCLTHHGWKRQQCGKGPNRGKWFYVKGSGDDEGDVTSETSIATSSATSRKSLVF